MRRHRPAHHLDSTLTMATARKPKTLESGMIAGGVIIMLAVSGYFVGLRQTNSAISLTRPVEVVKGESHRDLTGARNVPTAVRYIDEDWSANGINAAWRNSLADFQQPPQEPPGAKLPVTLEQKEAALQARAQRRAFDGAPPVVPHPVTQHSSAACLACHGEGLQVKDRFAAKMSHAAFGGSCTQCHVSSQHAFTAAEADLYAAPLTQNTFRGKEAPVAGTRAWRGAPPTVPHRTLMRSDCMSCHGPKGLFALRTPHPERQSCSQCHVATAGNDQRQFLAAPPLDAAKPPPAAPGPVIREAPPPPLPTPAPTLPPAPQPPAPTPTATPAAP